MKDNNKSNNNSFFNNKNSFGMTSGDNDSNDYAFNNIPMGLSFGFTQNPAAMTAFQNMPEDKKKIVLEKAANVKSKKEMMSLIQDISINNI